MQKLTLNTKTPCEIFIERGILLECGRLLREKSGAARLVLVCGDTVDRLYADTAVHSLSQYGFEVHRFVYPHGESSKTPETLLSLLSFTAKCGLDRSDAIVALGGGVTGDIAGFASAVYMRGIDCIQIPTTLLSMVDSSVGGKTAVDLPEGKNLIGAFHQPRLVIIDPDTLGTLPPDSISDGCAEIVKYAVLCKPELCEMLPEIMQKTEEIIYECLKIKCRYIESDEFDVGQRRLLNLGHTVGHALEKYSEYTLSHGKAVAVGLYTVTRAAFINGDCDMASLVAVWDALSSVGLPCEYTADVDELCKLIMLDKKKQSVDITLVIPHSMGHCELIKLPVSELNSYLFGGEA